MAHTNGDYPNTIFKGWNILVVDDEPDSQYVARYILEFYGALLHTANNGREGLMKAQNLRPRLIIADLSMPVMDGWEMLRALRADAATADLIVVALTAHAMLGDRERALAAGFNAYLTKPLTAETFVHDLVMLIESLPALKPLLMWTR